jgi:hypothetical protein
MNDRELESLGLAGLVLAEADVLAWPPAQVGEAKGLREAITLAALALGSATAPIAHPALDHADLAAGVFTVEPRILEFSSQAPVEVRTIGSPEGLVRQDHPTVAVVDTRHSGPFVVSTARGTVLLVPGTRGLEIREVVQPLAVAPLAEISAPLADWLKTCSDPWLKQQLAPLVEAGDGWSTGVAAGMLARLLEPSRPRIEALRRGVVDPELAAPRRWVRALPAEALHTLERLALAEIDILHADLEQLEGAVDGDAPGWPVDWIAACRSRDDLEGVALLLREAGRGEGVERALGRVDRTGRRLHAGIPLRRIPRDERLTRAAQRDAEAWWGAPA